MLVPQPTGVVWTQLSAAAWEYGVSEEQGPGHGTVVSFHISRIVGGLPVDCQKVRIQEDGLGEMAQLRIPDSPSEGPVQSPASYSCNVSFRGPVTSPGL